MVLLPNKIILLGIMKSQEVIEERNGGEMTSKGVQAKLEAYNIPNSSPTQSPELGHLKIIIQTNIEYVFDVLHMCGKLMR